MQYFATHYWQSGDENVTSLVLQQAYHKKRRMPVLLACVCTGAEKKYGTSDKQNTLPESLADWFYGTGLSLCGRKGEKGVKNIAESLEENLRRYLSGSRTDSDLRIAGILCVGHCFLIFQRGKQRISLLNIRNQHPHCHDMAMCREDTNRLYFQTGVIQCGVGVLLAAEEFHAPISRSMLEECLDVRELCSQNQVDRHLRELAGFAEQQGGRNMGAVLIVAR